MDLKGKIAVITGGSRGIGQALAKKLDEEGMKLVLIAKSEERLKDSVKQLSGEGHAYFACDLSSIEEVGTLTQKIKEKYKGIDLLVNGAGIGVYKPIEEATVEEMEESLAIGVKATFVLVKELAPLMAKSDLSLVINIGSGMGVMAAPGRSIYCTMKFALRGLTLSLAEEFKRSKPNFCLMTLGSVLTSFGPMSMEEKRLDMESGKAYLTPEWVAGQMVEIIKNENREVEYPLYPSDYSNQWQKAVK